MIHFIMFGQQEGTFGGDGCVVHVDDGGMANHPSQKSPNCTFKWLHVNYISIILIFFLSSLEQVLGQPPF